MSRSKNTLKRDIGHPEEGTGFEGEFDHQSLGFHDTIHSTEISAFPKGLGIEERV